MKQVWEAKMCSKRKRGRSRKAIVEMLQKQMSNGKEAKITANNKSEWNPFAYQ